MLPDPVAAVTAPATAPDDFATAWEDFFRAVRRAKGRAAARPARTGLSTAQYHLLAPLAHGSAQTIRALAEAAGVAAPTATRMLDGLERDGLVRRTPCRHDRRRVEVALTDAGQAALAATAAAVEEARRRIGATLSAEDRAQAARLLRRLAAVVEEQLA